MILYIMNREIYFMRIFSPLQVILQPLDVDLDYR